MNSEEQPHWLTRPICLPSHCDTDHNVILLNFLFFSFFPPPPPPPPSFLSSSFFLFLFLGWGEGVRACVRARARMYVCVSVCV